jgi:methyl-accepting chemotaxis protein
VKRIRLVDLPLIAKIGFAPALALFMMAAMAAVSVMAQMRSASDLQEAVHVGMADSIQIQRISERITEAHGRLYILLTHQAGKIDVGKIEAQTKELVSDLSQIEKDIAAVEALAADDQKPQFAKLIKQVEETRSAADLVGSMMTADFSAAASFISPFEQSYKQMVETLAQVVRTTQNATNARAAESEARARSTEILLGLGALATLLIVAWIAVVSVFATRKDIRSIADATEKLAGGDNAIDLDAMAREDEMGAIIRSLTVFRDNQLRIVQMRKENEEAQAARAREVAAVISALADGMDHLAACDISYRLNAEFPPEYRRLRDDFNNTMQELEGTLKVITNVTADIQAATAGGKGDAARRSDGKAATLKETGAALVSALEAFRENEKRMVRMREENQAAREAKAREQANVVAMLASGLDRLAVGDLTCQLMEEFPEEYRRLQDNFNAAMRKLEETLSTIHQVTGVIQSGSGDVNVAVDDLLRRTEHQAATLEETAAALDEITATVKSTAQGASNVRESIASAKEDAIGSGHVVSDAVSAMHEIKSSADQISQIVGAIDEIAFQTNLLALNAGVEAARAGEAGRGFAVVATEVRELSHRTAKMAKEIKNLIVASGVKVQQGVTLVGDAGKALERIVAQIVGINDVVGQIAASAKEQATGLEQINTAVNEMDNVTQQNAAMVQETTVASRSLAEQAEELVSLLGRFKVQGTMAVAKAAAHKPVGTARPAAHAAPARKVAAAGGKLPAAKTEEWTEF